MDTTIVKSGIKKFRKFMNIIGIIPARMASTRFPNKPMANILGMPMIGHCLKEV